MIKYKKRKFKRKSAINGFVRPILVRKESFGGTLFDVSVGKRAYINKNEFDFIRKNLKVSNQLAKELGLSCFKCSIVEPLWIPNFNFSSPDTVFFEITRSCNLNCTNCFNNSGKMLRGELTRDQQMIIIMDLKKTGVQEIDFTGGEPLIVPHIYELLSLSSALGMRNYIGTNATLVSKIVAKKLAEAGLDLAVVSVDGLGPVHDATRGKGSFKRTMSGIKKLIRAGIDVNVNMVVKRSNMANVKELVCYFYQMGIPVFLRRLVPTGRASGEASGMLSKSEYHKLEEDLKLYLGDGKLVRGHYLNESRDRIVPRINISFPRPTCSAGTRGMVILPDGRVQTCGFLGPLGENPVGRVPREPFARIWRRLLISDHIKTLRENIVSYNCKTNGPCTDCLAIALAAKKLERKK